MGDLQRLSALETYLSSFVDGISSHIKYDGKLHVRLLQHRTATGRFSGADPNMQNMPRGGTFPVKKVFVSRWEGGQILEADFAQLEFRTAAFLSQDKIAMKEIEDGFDVHSYTASVISNAGEKILAKKRKHTRLHPSTEQQDLAGHLLKLHIINTSQTSTKKSHYGIPDWLKKL